MLYSCCPETLDAKPAAPQPDAGPTDQSDALLTIVAAPVGHQRVEIVSAQFFSSTAVRLSSLLR